MIPACSQRGMTFVEVLAALALLSMLVAATSSLTSHIARVSADRQAEATVRSALGATVDLITADLDAWSAAQTAIDQGESDRPPVVTTVDGVEILFSTDENRPARVVTYRFDELSGRLTRADTTDESDQPRDLMGRITRFEVSVTETGGSSGDELLLIEIATEHGITRSAAVYLPPSEPRNG
ncbi:MAG: prepilin-type N-terminal cleavage/methylation domain-containing protein [bacterium]|nr:prepilin-type N-terminal cleavage/methylation domain-containing protein [bacterium]